MKTKRSSCINLSAFLGLTILLLISCKKDDLQVPILTTTDITSINQVSAISGGEITSEGSSSVASRGVCWSTSIEPSITTDNKTNDGTGIGSFTSSITGLSPKTTYFVRAFATNSSGTGYGIAKSFSTDQETIPVITTVPVSSITQTTATSGGAITTDGAASITARGVCWSTSQNPTIADNTTSDGTGLGDFTSTITGLLGNTTYYLRGLCHK